MKITVSVIKADIGSVGGHIAPSAKLIETVKKHVQEKGRGFLIDHYVSFTGDDIAILMTHRLREERQVHKLAWDAFVAGTAVAKAQGLYGAGQDLLKDAFSGNVHGMGPAVTEWSSMNAWGALYVFAADKTDPGAFNFPLYLAFADAMNTPGLMLSPKLAKGFKFVIMDVNYTEGDRVIELNAPGTCTISPHCSGTRNGTWSSRSGRVHQERRPYRGNVEAPQHRGKVYRQGRSGDACPDADGFSRYRRSAAAVRSSAILLQAACVGRINMPIMPVKLNTTISYFDGPPVVSCAAFCIRDLEN